ncbi:SDR family oxidoreductase [Alloalcanivorax mobilis]|uniref:SDR family oxidoreductase n=1 Tax=Alloalcanivorax mobilis TaxID=2019569 RepID=UPI000C77A12C|nr:SDR family NAD(P)-dependent oxidoreductase [Alloalcanivorax mobilis]
MRFSNKVAVITGAAQGIGEGVARRLAEEGARVALLDLDLQGAERVAATLPGDALALRCDVSQRDQVEDSLERVQQRFGRLDVLVCNAGLTRDNLIHKMTDDDWDRVIDTHLKGSFLCCRAAQRYMVDQRYGKIVLMSSRAALGNRGQSNYAAAKAGLQGMARVLAMELGPFNINVNAIAPGHIETEMTRATAARIGIDYQQLQEKTIQANAIKRVGQPEDIAAAAAFLAADEAGFITGQVLWVAGRPTV